jgi:RNA polymerase sigma-70 factor (ECF subfamily)
MWLVADESDVALARDLMSGDLAAFDRFVDAYHTKLFRYVFTMCGHRDDAEEISQETLLKAFQSLAQLREPEHLKAWLFRIAKNACLMKRRKSVFAPVAEQSLDELRPSKFGGGSGDGLKLEIADWSALPDDAAANAELHRALERAIRELPQPSRMVFLLRDVEGLSTAETAHALELGEDVVKQRLHRARLTLRKSLDVYARGVS